jgi:hypothetical protein
VDTEALMGMRGGMVALVAEWLVQKSDDLLAPHSWAWTLLREACFTVQGKGRYTEEALRGAWQSLDTGPLGCLALADVLARFQPPLAREVAARGLERLSAADFRCDCRLLLTGDSILSECCQALVTGLRDIDPGKLDALLSQEPAFVGNFVRDGMERLRADTNQPVFEALAPALDGLWDGGLKQRVAEALQAQAVDPAKTFKNGLAAYQNVLVSKAVAANLFAQAAAHGHAAAQYYLGMMYEKGEGVPKDRMVALRWYTQSATNGYEEAAATLGNIYSDGLVVKQDYAEAYVWFSVAAARHHPLAEVFRNAAQRKLSPSELTAARKRVAAILEAMPSPGQRSSSER